MPDKKFSQFTQQQASLLKVNAQEIPNFYVAGHTEKAGAEDNIKFPLLDLLNAAGGDTTYASAEDDALAMPQTIGGLPAGTTASTLKQMTLSEVLDAILFPVVLPTRSTKSFNFASFAQAGLQEIGTALTVNLATVFSQGQITNGTGAQGPTLVGAASLYEFTGPGITGTLSQNAADAGAGTAQVNFDVVAGSQQWSATVNHLAGTGGYTDSKGNPSTIFDAERVAASSSANSAAITGIYPILYGANAADYSVSGGYSNLTKLIEQKSSKSLTVNANNEYLYFAFPASYGDLSSIRDGNGFDVTSSFQKVGLTMASTGLSADWSVGYTMYRTNAPTTINGQTYQFIWQ